MNRYPFHIDAPSKGDPNASEIAVQASFRQKMRNEAPEVMLVAIPNAGRRSEWERLQRGKEGLVPGFPDMLALWNGGSAFLEFKAHKGSLSVQQIDVLNRLVRIGKVVGVFRSADTAVEWLRGHGAPFLSEVA